MKPSDIWVVVESFDDDTIQIFKDDFHIKSKEDFLKLDGMEFIELSVLREGIVGSSLGVLGEFLLIFLIPVVWVLGVYDSFRVR